MNVLAYCDERYLKITRQVAGERATVISSPPLFAGNIEPTRLSGHDLLYIDLHGQPGSVYLYSGPKQSWGALHVDAVRAANLRGTVVFATTCYLPQTPFLQAFLDAGALAVIGGQGRNWSTSKWLSGATLLAQLFAQQMANGLKPLDALHNAKTLLSRRMVKRLLYRNATADAMNFRIWRM